MIQKKLYQAAKKLMFRRRMVETLRDLEEEIRTALSNEQKEEMITSGFKISIKEEGQIAITELPLINLEQLELPLAPQTEQSHKGGKES